MLEWKFIPLIMKEEELIREERKVMKGIPHLAYLVEECVGWWRCARW